MEAENAVYGIIKPAGDEFSVVFAIQDDDTRHELHGYGEFPHDRFPDVPLVSFEGNLTGMIEFMRAEIYCIETAAERMYVTTTLVTLEEFLRQADIYGAKIILPGSKKLQVYIDDKWMFVFARNKSFSYPITTLNRDTAIPATQHSFGYFTRYFPNHTFRYSN